MSSAHSNSDHVTKPRPVAKLFAYAASVILLGLLIAFVAGGGHHAPGGHHDSMDAVAAPIDGESGSDESLAEVEVTHTDDHAHAPALWGLGIMPFICILGCIAILPLIPATEHWWESNLSRYIVSLAMALLTVVYVWLTADGDAMNAIGLVLDHAILLEYVPFIILLFSLYVISGGIQLSGDVAAKPLTNTIYLAIGGLIASFIGTTGASMLLIRPLLNTNRERKHKIHTIVMFIFVVSNIGGSLLPIGDPPLFLGYLAGVPFFWTLTLWGPWLFTGILLLVIYFIWDTIMYRRESPAAIAFDTTNVEPLRLRGLINIPWLLGVIVCVAFVNPNNPLPGTHWHPFEFAREGLMILLVLLSLLTTPRGVRAANQFNYHAIIEVAALFVGIFITMQIPLEVLKAHGGAITAEFNEPWMYFWLTGGLSSVLDNAPTYLVFFNLAQTGDIPAGTEMLSLGYGAEIPVDLLIGISLGAVFMGSMTYIGNGPNFMVKAIAEQSGVKMPSFIGFVFKYSIPVLVPVFILVVLLFMVF